MTRLSRFLPKFLRGDKGKLNNDKVADKSHCKIMFLDDTEYFLPYKGGLKGQYVLEKIYEQLNLFETDYFGLRYIDHTGQTHWLESNKSLSSQLKGCSIPYTFYFGVKFYPADPCKLKEEITRYQFFLQLKRDILHGRLPVTFDEAIELFAYAVQSELGDFESQELQPGYVSEFQFVPNQTEELEERIAVIHRRLGGTVPATAELKFLDKVKWLDMYGVDLHPVMGEGNTEYFLGLTPTGIVVYKNKTKVGNYFWPRITKVTNKAKVFIIRVKDKINDEHTYAFELPTKAACKHLWKCCVEHHAFFRLNQVNTSTTVSRAFRSTSKHRNSGRQERQNHASHGGREQPQVLRVQSRRQARRALSDSRLNQGDRMQTGLQYSEGHVTMVVNPEPVKGSRHRSLPDLKGRESPTSTRSAPWETNMDTGMYTTGRESPVSVTQSENVNYLRRHRDSDSESGHRRKYFPSSRKGSDNESDVSFTRRRRRELDSGSESDISPKYTARQRNAKSVGADAFEQEWQDAMQHVFIPGKDSNGRPNGSLHSAPLAEAKQKRMRRRRSKSPGNKRPPEELRQHIEFDLIDPEQLTEEQMREIPYVNVETKAAPFKVKYSPKTRQRYRSPKRKSASDVEPSTRGGGYISEDSAPAAFPPSPQRPLPEPATSQRQANKPAGYHSDTGSHVDSLSRNRLGQPVIPAQYRSAKTNNNNINPDSKPIESQEDKHSVIDVGTTNSTTQHQNATDPGVVGAQELRLDLQGHLSGEEGQGHDPDEDRNRDSGLNSSQSSSSAAWNTTPRSAAQHGTPRSSAGQQNRMFGTQDAIARLYSSPATGHRSLNPPVTQSTASTNRNVPYKLNTNQNLPYNHHQSPSQSVQHNQIPVPSSVPSYQTDSGSPSKDAARQYGHMNGGYNRSQQQFYNQPNRTQNQTQNYSQNENHGQQQEYSNDYRNQSSFANVSYSQQNRNAQYGALSHASVNNSPTKSYPPQQTYHNSYPTSSVQSTFQSNSSQSNAIRMEQNSRVSQYQSGNNNVSQYQSSGDNRLGLQPSWQYVGNSDVRSASAAQSSYRPSPAIQRNSGKSGTSSPYTRSPASSPSKNQNPGTGRHIELSPAPQDKSGVAYNQSLNSSRVSAPKFHSPDSAISSLTSLTHTNNNYIYTSPGMGKKMQQPVHDGSVMSPGTGSHDQNFSRTRAPAFGTSDIWTEL